MIMLQERDKAILRLCYEQQFVLTEHIETYFSQVSYQACRKRITELVSAFYLREELTQVLGKKPIYRVTKLGAAVALENGALPVGQARVLQATTLVHDSIVTSVRLRLQSFWDAKFTCERAIKGSEYRQIPDGIFTFRSGKGIAIEVENSDKGRNRFIGLLRRWRDTPHISFVLYVATNDSLFESIQKWLAHGPKEKPLGVVRWKDLATQAPPIWTCRGELKLLERREF